MSGTLETGDGAARWAGEKKNKDVRVAVDVDARRSSRPSRWCRVANSAAEPSSLQPPLQPAGLIIVTDVQ